LKSLFTLCAEKNRAIKTKELADALQVSSASVTEMIGKLTSQGLVESEPYYGFSLTRKGVLEAFKVLRKHRLLERFLVDTLGLPESEVHAEAHRLEHVVSDEALDRIDHLPKCPDSCPHESKIPDKETNVIALNELEHGQKAKIVFSKLKASKTLDRLNAMGLVPETQITLVRRLKKGPTIIRVRGSEIVLDREIASSFYVER